jgi:outer membrane lipoprotein-sorting protein
MRTITLIFMSFFLFLGAGIARAQSSDDLVRKIEAMLAPPNIRATYVFVNTRLDGSTTSYEINLSIRDPDHNHLSFVKPEREKGREILRLKDDIWSFVPSIGRIVRIADRDSFAGGDFSNADVLRVDWLDHYKTKILKDLPKQWIIELDARTSEASYARMRLWVDKASGQPVQQLYYDSQGTLLKRCLYGDTRNFDGITRPSRLVMENVISRQKSELIVLSIQKVSGFPESRFIIDNLGK